MALKLITRADALLENEELGIKLRLGRLRPEHIAEIQGLLRESRNAPITVGIYVLREAASFVEIGGETYDPRSLSHAIDPTDEEAAVALVGIAALAVDELLVTPEAQKKSSAPRARTSDPSGAAHAR